MTIAPIGANPETGEITGKTGEWIGGRIGGAVLPPNTRNPITRTFHVADFGAVGDWAGGTTGTDDTAAINAACAAAYAAGGGAVVFDGTKGYKVTGATSSGGVVLDARPGVSLWGNGATLAIASNTSHISAKSTTTLIGSITVDTLATDTVVTLDTTDGLTVGDEVLVKLGQSAYDALEPAAWLFAKVVALTSTTVTLDRPLGYAMSVAATPDTLLRRVLKISNRIEDIEIRGFNLVNPMTGGANAESGVRLSFARRVTVDDITATDPGAGAILAQFCDDIKVPSVSVVSSVAQGGQASKGRGLNFAECRNVRVGTFYARGFQRAAATIEGGCDSIVFDNVRLVNDFAGRSTTSVALFQQLGNRSLEVKNLVLEGFPSFVSDKGGTGEGVFSLGNFTILTSDNPVMNRLSEVNGALVTPSGAFSEIRKHVVTFRLLPSQTSKAIPLPLGRLRRVKAYASTLTGVSSFYVSRDAAVNGPNQLSRLVAAQTVDLTQSIAGLGSVYPVNSNDNKRLLYTTDATVPAGAYMVVEVEFYVPITGGTTVAGALTTNLYDRVGVAVPPALAAAATDAATTQTLVNSIRTALINLGLGT